MFSWTFNSQVVLNMVWEDSIIIYFVYMCLHNSVCYSVRRQTAAVQGQTRCRRWRVRWMNSRASWSATSVRSTGFLSCICWLWHWTCYCVTGYLMFWPRLYSCALACRFICQLYFFSSSVLKLFSNSVSCLLFWNSRNICVSTKLALGVMGLKITTLSQASVNHVPIVKLKIL